MSQVFVESFSPIAHRQYFLGGFWLLALATRVGNRKWCFMIQKAHSNTEVGRVERTWQALH